MSTWRPSSEISRSTRNRTESRSRCRMSSIRSSDSSLFYSRATSGRLRRDGPSSRAPVGLSGGSPSSRRIPRSSAPCRSSGTEGGARSVEIDDRPPPGHADRPRRHREGIRRRPVRRRPRGLGVRSALVNIGGNIYGGSSPGKKGWSIGVRDPEGSLETVGTSFFATRRSDVRQLRELRRDRGKTLRPHHRSENGKARFARPERHGRRADGARIGRALDGAFRPRAPTKRGRPSLAHRRPRLFLRWLTMAESFTVRRETSDRRLTLKNAAATR